MKCKGNMLVGIAAPEKHGLAILALPKNIGTKLPKVQV